VFGLSANTVGVAPSAGSACPLPEIEWKKEALASIFRMLDALA
jgi:hypothetical protein